MMKPSKVATPPGRAPSNHAQAGKDHRHSQRVLLRVPAKIYVSLQGKLTTIEATTLSVNTHGAILVAKQSLPAEERVVLEHGTTHEKIPCRVTRAAHKLPEGFHIPIEFESPSPNFWRIVFPAPDWPPENL